MRRADEDDYREYVAARMERLRRTAYLLCHDWHRADDIVSVTLGRLYRHWQRVRRVERLDAYVGRMLVNAWHDEGRRSARETVVEQAAVEGGRPGPDVVERLSQLELLKRLPPRRREAVVLRFYYDLSVQETAAALGCSEGTVKSLTSRGLESLRALTVLTEAMEDR